jgi:Fe-S-cluster containining protein
MTYPPSDKEFLDPKTFKCTKCGECCRPIVKVTEKDIKRIEQTKIKREEFLAFDPLEENPNKKDTLKQNNNVCMFLKRKGEEYFCSIYEHRPDFCRMYPFYKENMKLKDCRPTYLREPPPLNILVKE